MPVLHPFLDLIMSCLYFCRWRLADGPDLEAVRNFIVERGNCGLRRELGTPVTAVRVARIHLIDGDVFYEHIYWQERLGKSAMTRYA